MATTKIWKVTERLDHVIDYVSNEEKTIDTLLNYTERDAATEDKKYVTSINCSIENPSNSMMALKEMNHDKSHIYAYHAVQSFKPGEGNPNLIHAIGIETAEKCWADKYQVVVTTHLDKGHLHNHFVINPISIIDGKRYNNSKKDIQRLRDISDEICKEHGLSIIENPKGKGFNRKQYNAVKSYMRDIKTDIDQIILDYHNTNMDRFFSMMRLEGYLFEDVDGVECIFHPNYEKPIPIALLGNKYSYDSIKDRMINVDRTLQGNRYYTGDDASFIYHQYKHNKLHGFQLFLVEFQVKLGVLPQRHGKRIQLSKECRQQLRKLDMISTETTLLVKNNITDFKSLNDFKDGLQQKLDENVHKRKKLNNESYRTDDLIEKSKLSEEAKKMTPEIQKLRYEIKCLDDVKYRSISINELNLSLDNEVKNKCHRVNEERSGR